MKPMHVISLVVLGIVAIIGANSAFVVREVEQAMVLTFGKIDKVITEPGLHFKTPLVQQVSFFDKRMLETDATPEEVQTRDKKRVVVDSFTRWQIADARKFYETVKTVNSARSRLDIIVNSAIRNVVAREDLAELVSGDRARLMNEIVTESRREAANLGVNIVDVRIKRADLPEANSRAVFNRMQAERQKEAKEIRAQGAEESQKIKANADRERTIILAEAKRDSEKIRGEGDAIAIRTFAKAYEKDPSFYDLSRSLEAYKNSLKGEDTLMVLDPSVEFLGKF